MPCHIKAIKRIDKDRAKILISAIKALVIDVRSLEEWQQGHLSIAKHIELLDLENRIDEFSNRKNQTIMLYCQSGRRSEKAKKILENLGYSKVINLGGLMEAKAKLGAEISSL